MKQLRTFRALSLAIVIMPVLASCGGDPDVYVAPNGSELRFIADQEIQRTYNNRVFDGTYEWVRDAQGQKVRLVVDDGWFGETIFLPDDNGCLTADRFAESFCPR